MKCVHAMLTPILKIKLLYGPHGSIRWPLVLSARKARVSKDRPALTTSGPIITRFSGIGIINKKLILSLLLFLAIICVLGIPWTHWWFCGGDDFHGLFCGSKAQSLKDLFYYFIDGHINQLQAPSNGISSGYPSFFSCYYRPFYRVFLALQYWLFGEQAYYYFLCNAFFHAFNTVLLFNIFCYFASYGTSLLGALFFAVHPQIAYRFGAIVNFHYYVNVCCMLLCIMVFKKYLDTKQLRYHLLASLLFGVAVFTRESSIVLPGIMVLGTLLYRWDGQRLSCAHLYQQLKAAILSTAGLWITAGSFLALRLYLYPLATNTAQTIASGPLQLLKSIPQFFILKQQEFLVCLYDALGLSWLPWGHPMLRLALLIIIATILLWFFVRNTQKIVIIFLLLSTAIMLWPAYVGFYSPRYIYEALPFLIAAYIITFTYATAVPHTLKRIGFALGTICILFYAAHVVDSFRRREAKMFIMQQATMKLVHNPLIHNRALMFIGYPNDGFGGHPAHLFWALLKNPNIPIFCDPSTAITQADSNIVVPTTWRNVISAYFARNYHTVTISSDRLSFHSCNPTKVQFFLDDGGYSLGQKTILHTMLVGGKHVITYFMITLEPRYLEQKPLIITWDYATQQFVIHNLY
jgi:hypothetical protein